MYFTRLGSALNVWNQSWTQTNWHTGFINSEIIEWFKTWTLVETGNIFLPIRNVQNQGLCFKKNKPWSLVISQISTPDFLLLSGNITVSFGVCLILIFNNSPLYYLDKAHLHKLLTSPSTQPSLNKLCNH